MRVSDILMRVSECYTFELAIITRSLYKTAALYTNGIISFTSVLKDLSKTVTMVHTYKVYKHASYEEYRDNGMFSSEANCMQFLYDLKILRTVLVVDMHPLLLPDQLPLLDHPAILDPPSTLPEAPPPSDRDHL